MSPGTPIHCNEHCGCTWHCTCDIPDRQAQLLTARLAWDRPFFSWFQNLQFFWRFNLQLCFFRKTVKLNPNKPEKNQNTKGKNLQKNWSFFSQTHNWRNLQKNWRKKNVWYEDHVGKTLITAKIRDFSRYAWPIPSDSSDWARTGFSGKIWSCSY